MPNTNPIVVDTDPTPVPYIIPANFANTMIYATIKVVLADPGWQYAAATGVFCNGANLYPQKSPEPIDLKLGYAKDLQGKKAIFRTHISRFRAGSENPTPPIVTYHLILEAGDVLLDEFIKQSTTDNPSDFGALLTFNIQ